MADYITPILCDLFNYIIENEYVPVYWSLSDSIQVDDSSPFLGSMQINSLLYADDLVLIAKSKDDLQTLVNELHMFATKWFLNVNTKKTKSLVFSRKRLHRSKYVLQYGDLTLPQCDTYCYLGTIFSQNATFTLKQAVVSELHDKALKAMFSILRTVNKYGNCSTNVLIILFNALSVPIALYDSEVWGSMLFSENDINSDTLLHDSVISNLQKMILRITLGVSKRSSRWAILKETGQDPLTLRIMFNMVKY